MPRRSPLHAVLALAAVASSTAGPPIGAAQPDPARGLELLLERAYVEPAFDQEAFDAVWQMWEEPLRTLAEQSSPDERRRMAYRRYGLIERPGDPAKRPLQFVVDARGNWTINCLACHQGSVAGAYVPGAPNAQFAMETLVGEVRAAKLRLGKALSGLDRGALLMPLGGSVGTTNAVAFGVAVMHFRDRDMNRVDDRPPPALVHHDHDAPPWWNTRLKQRMYCDDFAPRGHRALMQFIAGRENDAEKFRAWEDDFRHIEAYIESLQPPAYPLPIDAALAERGRAAFGRACAECHGTYGEGAEYPERVVPWEEIGTDPVRLRSLTATHRRDWGENWINAYGAAGDVLADPGGYLAPPLNGVWASAPYFHNGSVPTLWHVLRPASRPVVWRHADAQAATPQGVAAPAPFDGNFDWLRVGLAVETVEATPPRLSAAERRRYFDARRFSKSAAGHDYPNVLSEDEKAAVLEYLKTL
jgi:mono/diheme cytochrome c family protein